MYEVVSLIHHPLKVFELRCVWINFVGEPLTFQMQIKEFGIDRGSNERFQLTFVFSDLLFA